MKRITIVAILAIFSAASAGCIQQTSSTAEETSENASVSKPNDGTPADSQSAEYRGAPAQSLELDIHPANEGQGPHPEPWLDQQGPHPEPWTGRAIIIATDPKGSGTATKP